MIELFARQPLVVDWSENWTLQKVAVEDDLISLSAILLDEAYFSAMKNGSTDVDGISILDETLLIPFKAKAHLDLNARKAEGETVKSVDLKKHARDVFRLVQLVVADNRITLPDTLAADLTQFLFMIEQEGTLNPKAFDVDITRSEGIALIRTVYRLTDAV